MNVILWIEDEEEWVYGEEAAAATSAWLPIPEQPTADIAFNGVHFEWAIAPDGSLAPETLDIQGIATHEIGHLSGLADTTYGPATMYFAWRPWPSQRTLDVDDERGICSVYPQEADECAAAAECASDETCEPYELGTLCTMAPDPIGAPCNHDRVECEEFCLFMAVDLSVGYCSRFCDGDEECPATHHCGPVSAGTETEHACLWGSPPDAGVDADADTDADAEQEAPDGDAGVELDADRAADGEASGLPCDGPSDCPDGQHCGEAGLCTLDCRTDPDCPAGRCTADGRCVPRADEGCGCRAAGSVRARAGDFGRALGAIRLGGGTL